MRQLLAILAVSLCAPSLFAQSNAYSITVQSGKVRWNEHPSTFYEIGSTLKNLSTESVIRAEGKPIYLRIVRADGSNFLWSGNGQVEKRVDRFISEAAPFIPPKPDPVAGFFAPLIALVFLGGFLAGVLIWSVKRQNWLDILPVYPFAAGIFMIFSLTAMRWAPHENPQISGNLIFLLTYFGFTLIAVLAAARWLPTLKLSLKEMELLADLKISNNFLMKDHPLSPKEREWIRESSLDTATKKKIFALDKLKTKKFSKKK